MPLDDLLKSLPYFTNLTNTQFEDIASIAEHHTFETEEIIFLQGDSTSGLWLIEMGSVKISKLTPEGGEYILHLLGSGDTFNDISALDGGLNPANATALSLSTCWRFPSDSLRYFLQRHPEVSHNVIGLLAERIRALSGQIESLTLHPVTARLARFLLKQAHDPSLSGPGITRAAIAGHLATTPETISRSLSKLQDAGAIRFDRHRILIIDRDQLEELAEL